MPSIRIGPSRSTLHKSADFFRAPARGGSELSEQSMTRPPPLCSGSTQPTAHAEEPVAGALDEEPDEETRQAIEQSKTLE